MKEKLQQLMKSEGLTSSRMADILGIQPSGISHILSGRNKPGFDLLQKILRRFPRINPDWLLLDSPQMYRPSSEEELISPPNSTTGSETGLFASVATETPLQNDAIPPKNETSTETSEFSRNIAESLTALHSEKPHPIVRVILVYADRSFEALTLRNHP